jgi:(p)ppGpp synthase/HD superfamily hydrolase
VKDDTEVTLARVIAHAAHQGQIRWGGLDYMQAHVLPIAAKARALYGPQEEAVALLHDVLEDSNCDPAFLRVRGISSETIRSVQTLTHQAGESYRRYVERIRDSGDVAAIRVKLLDLENNLAAPPPPHWPEHKHKTHEQRRGKYELAQLVLGEALARLTAT